MMHTLRIPKIVGMALIIPALLSLCTAFFSVTVYAESGSSDTEGGCKPGQLCNPLEAETVQELLMNIIEILLVFAVPIIVVFIMYAGYLFVTARGDTGQISDAKHALTWAIVGGVIVLGAKVIIEVVQGTVDAL